MYGWESYCHFSKNALFLSSPPALLRNTSVKRTSCEGPQNALKLGIRDFKENSARDRDWNYAREVGYQKITLGITGLHEISGRDYGIEEPYWGPSLVTSSALSAWKLAVHLVSFFNEKWTNHLMRISEYLEVSTERQSRYRRSRFVFAWTV